MELKLQTSALRRRQKVSRGLFRAGLILLLGLLIVVPTGMLPPTMMIPVPAGGAALAAALLAVAARIRPYRRQEMCS